MVALTAAVLVALSACGMSSDSSSTIPASPTSDASATVGAAASPRQIAAVDASHTEWLLSAGALERLASAGMPKPLLEAFFDHPSTLLIGEHATTDPLVPSATPVMDFTSATALASALESGQVPARVSYLLLDLEAWPLTPEPEQTAPLAAAREALAVAHRYSKKIIFTPALDLLKTLTPGQASGQAAWEHYDRLLAGPGAEASDVFEIQAQSTEGSPYATSATDDALGAAKAAHPGEPVLVGLSTNPDGRKVSPADLLALYHATLSSAAGYWLNIPQAGTACPRCGAAQPQVAVAFLEDVAQELAGGSPPGSGSPDRASAAPGVIGTRRFWLLAASQFSPVVGDPAARALLSGSTVLEPIGPHEVPSNLLPVVPTLVVHSEALLAQDVADGQVPDSIRAVLYDNERFADTPADEQADPMRYDELVAQMAEEHGWVSICDFVQPDRLPKSARVPEDEVPPCDIVGLNTVQQSERDPGAYATLVEQMVGAVRTMAPTTPVIAGLSSNPSGSPVTSAEIANDIEATWRTVDGYWLNVPSPGVGCPHCHEPDPTLMADALAGVDTWLITGHPATQP